MKKSKFYVVWKGRKTGIYENWDACQQQINGFPQAAYKSFLTKAQAQAAFKGKYEDHIEKSAPEPETNNLKKIIIGEPIWESISVDGAWNTATGAAEYQGVETESKKILFRQGPFEDGTNNIVEFLAIVHGLAYLKQKNSPLPIYSDSRNAIGWIMNKKARTNHQKNERNQVLFDLIERAEKWLEENDYTTKILKWETKSWGENPADFGRK